MAAKRRGWRYFATRLDGKGNEVMLDPDLPLEDVTIEDTLSGDAAISGKISPVYARLIAADDELLLSEWSTALYAENDGDIRAGAILTHSGFDGPEWSLEAVGFTGYGRDMPYTGDGFKGVEVDAIDCARVIWTHIQAQKGGNIGLELDTTDTNGKVMVGSKLAASEYDPGCPGNGLTLESTAWKLNWYSNHDLQGDFDDLASATPFDYREKHSWRADGTIRHFVEIGYPKLGRRRTDLRFVYGVNVFDPVQIDRDGDLYASGTLVLGAGEGAGMMMALREQTIRPGNRLRRIAVVTDDRIKHKDRAVKRAEQENQWRSRMDDLDSIVVRDHPHARLGSVAVGDEIRIEGQGDWVDVDLWVRVLSISYQPGDGNQAEYTVARTDKLTS